MRRDMVHFGLTRETLWIILSDRIVISVCLHYFSTLTATNKVPSSSAKHQKQSRWINTTSQRESMHL